MKYVVVSDGELSIAGNQIKKYAEFLVSSIEEYVRVLAEIQNEMAISDDLFCAKLSELAEKILPYKNEICDECDRITQIIIDDVEEIASADNFRYPSEIISSISAQLARFL